jgi:hypothetical protein
MKIKAMKKKERIVPGNGFNTFSKHRDQSEISPFFVSGIAGEGRLQGG